MLLIFFKDYVRTRMYEGKILFLIQCRQIFLIALILKLLINFQNFNIFSRNFKHLIGTHCHHSI